MMPKEKQDAFTQEARFLKSGKLDLDLIDVFVGQRDGTRTQRERLRKAVRSLKKRIYVEAVYLLTHTLIEELDEAKRVFNDILQHRNEMVQVLGRNVSVQVAALDYMQDVRNILKRPTIIEADKYHDFAYRAIVDETTNTYDKDMLDAQLDAEIEKARRFGQTFCVLFIDIDNLKQINDKHGHQAGTKVIQHVSACTRKNLRKYDSVYRYGGDEFVVLLSRAGNRQARRIAARIHELVRKGSIKTVAQRPTVSIGIAAFDGKRIRDRESLVRAADRALYQAKDRGRDRIALDGETGTSVSTAKQKQGHSVGRPAHRRKVLKGLSLVEGYGIGTVFYYQDVTTREVEERDLHESEIDDELERINDAVDRVEKDVKLLRGTIAGQMGEHPAQIFDVHGMILRDANLMNKLEDELREKKLNAEQVVKSVFHQLEKRFRDSSSDMLQQKVQDVHDVGGRILKVLTGVERNVLADVPADAVVFSRRLLPSDTVHFVKRRPMAIVTHEGGPSSHSALIAKAMGIPSVSGISLDGQVLTNGSDVIVDGGRGVVVLNPGEKEKQEYARKMRAMHRRRELMLRRTKRRSLQSREGRIVVNANCSSKQDVKAAVRNGCDGIGLYRVEPLYMAAHALPDELWLYEQLADTLAPLGNRTATLRVTDFGGDKKLPYLDFGREHDSLLGLRGIRLLFKHRSILKTQLRVFYRLAARFKLRILIPMVALEDDMKQVRAIIDEVKKGLAHEALEYNGDVPIGAMLETPSSVLTLREIARHSDFVSIGSNDLVQYLMAADRENLNVSDYYERGNAIVLEYVRRIVEGSRAAGISCSLCGELAADLRYTGELLTCGLRDFSVLPPHIPAVKDAVYEALKASGGRPKRGR